MTPSRLLLKICFKFIWISLLDFKFSTQFIGWRFNDLSGELDNFYRFNYCIFAFAVGNTVMAEWLIDWLTVRLAYGANYTISMVIVTVVIVYHAHYCFCVGFLFSYIPTYINAFYFLQSRQIKSFQPTGSSSAIRSNSGKRVPVVELTIKSFVYKIS